MAKKAHQNQSSGKSLFSVRLLKAQFQTMGFSRKSGRTGLIKKVKNKDQRDAQFLTLSDDRGIKVRRAIGRPTVQVEGKEGHFWIKGIKQAPRKRDSIAMTALQRTRTGRNQRRKGRKSQ